MKAFPWRAGMRALDRRGNPWRVYYDGSGGLSGQGEPAGYTADWLSVAELLGATPDPNDGATKGALLEAVREAWKDPDAYAYHDGDEWCVPIAPSGTLNANDWLLFAGPSEFAALEAAWQAAP